MRDRIKRQRSGRDGFTLTELSVLIGLGVVLTVVVLPELSQTHDKLVRQACAANLKHWAMAFELYSQDWKGRLYYLDKSTPVFVHWDDSSSPYARYLISTNPVQFATVRNMRICPAR